ncbi:MAG: metal-dependent transcriptional regulator [Bacilli bacterium]
MNTHESEEDYLERILMLEEKGKKAVHAIDIATSMSFSKPSVSIALKKLEDKGYVHINDHQELTLTEAGMNIASKIYERHQVIGSFLISLGVDKDTAYSDACKIEHDLSDKTFAALKKHYEEDKK